MPKDQQEHKTKQEQLSADEKFRSFFTTTVVDIPKEMTQEDLPDLQPEKKGLFGRLFGKKEREPQEDLALEIPTGEILLGEGAASAPEDDMDLMLRTADPEPAFPQEPPAPQPQPAQKPQPVPAPQPAPKKEQPVPEKKPEKPSQSAQQPAAPVSKPKPKKEKRPVQKNAPKELLPQEQIEQQEMQQLKQMLGSSVSQKAPAPQPKPKKELRPAKQKQPEPIPSPIGGIVFASEGQTAESSASTGKRAEELPVQSRTAEPTSPAVEPELKPAEDTFDTVVTPAAAPEPSPVPQPEPEQPRLIVEAEDLDEPEEIPVEDHLHRMSATLTLRCVLSGILAVVLLHFGLMAERLVPALPVLDPDAAPAAFYGANLLLLAASVFAAFPVVRDGLLGLRQRATLDSMPALAAAAALLQAVLALIHASAFRGAEAPTLLSGVAALGLFLALLGSRLMLASVQGGYEQLAEDAGYRGVYRAKEKELLRTLAQEMEQKDPWVLLSHPAMSTEGFVDQSLDERTSERRARKISYILLGTAVLSGLLLLITGKGLDKAVCAMTAVLCMGAPLSSTMISGLTSLRLYRSGAAAGAVVPGWEAIQELGGIDTIQVDADDLFTADSVQLQDIRIFKGGRIDRAILYAASILNQSCQTLQGLFRQIIEDRTDILFPVKDLEIRQGLGISAWCENNRVLIGTREYLEREEIALPEQEYEASHSQNGELQILYLAVSGNLHAMFVLKYVGGRNTARSLAALQKENIHLLVSSKDPSLKARHIAAAYHLPQDMITMLDQTQCAAIQLADAPQNCCMYYNKGFASLTGGLQAAEQAQNAETSATTVQLVSVVFSVAIALLLTWAGTIWKLSVATVLMYQAAWSALSIAVCALKQHN